MKIKVVCISVNEYDTLTIGKTYEVEDICQDYDMNTPIYHSFKAKYKITDDEGFTCLMYKHHFKELRREEKLERILNENK